MISGKSVSLITKIERRKREGLIGKSQPISMEVVIDQQSSADFTLISSE
jgi:hypothetical protein